MEVISFSPAKLPLAVKDQPYSAQIRIEESSAFNFSVAEGELPNGLSMNGNGLISGTPTVSGSFPVKIKAEDNAGNVVFKQY
ncbi:MAG TPA: Ig domain-containing protein [Flavipsychrobacter sp.]|nr:Ig domain-containing protein [Flavipsychrobacter sp.]